MEEKVKDLTAWSVEQALMHADKANKRAYVIIIMLIVALLGSNAGWLYYESQWEVVETTEQRVDQQADGDSSNTFVGGDLYGSTTDSNNDDNEK